MDPWLLPPSTEQSCSSFRLQEKGMLAAAGQGDVSLAVAQRFREKALQMLPAYAGTYVYIV